MIHFLHAAWVIGRRDFIASVWSRSFLFFLMGPLIIIGMSAGFGSITQTVARQNTQTVIAVIASKQDQEAIAEARTRLLAGLQDRAIAVLDYVDPAPDVDRQARDLLHARDKRVIAVLTGGLDHPHLSGAVASGDGTDQQLELVLDEARQQRAAERSGIAWQQADIPVTTIAEAAGPAAAAHAITATIGQLIVFFLTVLLSGMLISNLLEEKSNKVIEVLAAAVPVDAIFLGKIVSMLAISLTGITIWCTAGFLANLALNTHSISIPEPAVGWGWFTALCILYFSVNYLLLGALFLGIGSQASSVREIQTMSMPITVGQMLIFALAGTAAGAYNSPLGLFAAIFPFSSPLMMVGRAGQTPELWPHLIALLWQALWVWLVIRFGSALFRRNVLKSGPAFRRTALAKRRG
jgi:ABC-2 type transport system permease protein